METTIETTEQQNEDLSQIRPGDTLIVKVKRKRKPKKEAVASPRKPRTPSAPAEYRVMVQPGIIYPADGEEVISFRTLDGVHGWLKKQAAPGEYNPIRVFPAVTVREVTKRVVE